MASILEIAKWCAETGLRYHVFDSEWKENYLSMEELEKLLDYSESLNFEMVNVITVSVRHFGSMKIIKKLLKLSEKYGNLGLNFVAGNKVYLTTKERKRSAAKLLTKAVKLAAEHLEGKAIFVGVEGLVNTVARLVSNYEVTPFLLLDRNLEENVSKMRNMNNGCFVAIYAPFLVFDGENNTSCEVLRRMLDYALRRKWIQETLRNEGYDLSQVHGILDAKQENSSSVQCQKLKKILIDAIRRLSIFGDRKTISQTIQNLKEINVIIGLPMMEEEKQVKEFANIIQNSDL